MRINELKVEAELQDTRYEAEHRNEEWVVFKYHARAGVIACTYNVPLLAV